MNFPENQLDELKAIFPGVQYAKEGNYDYFLIPNVKLPEKCSPSSVDALLCPNLKDGYNSRLYFSEMVKSGKSLNWNAKEVRILERNWYAFSWCLKQSGLRLAQMATAHLRGLTC